MPKWGSRSPDTRLQCSSHPKLIISFVLVDKQCASRILKTFSSSHLQESGMQGSLCDVEHLRAVYAAIVINLLDDEPIGEGRDVQHVEQCGLAGTNLVASFDQVDVTLGTETHKMYIQKP